MKGVHSPCLAGTVVAGIGDEYRGDDGAGIAVAVAADRAGLERHPLATAEPLDLLDYWDGADLAVIVDAVRSGAPAGTVHVIELRSGPPDGEDTLMPAVTSTHGIGLVGVLRLAEVMGKAPKRVVLVGIEGETFDPARGLSPAVEAAVPSAVRLVLRLVRAQGRLGGTSSRAANAAASLRRAMPSFANSRDT